MSNGLRIYGFCVAVALGLFFIPIQGIGQKHQLEHHAVHLNHIALFLGSTSLYEQGRDHMTVGIDYMRFLKSNSDWGLSGFAEVVFANDIQWLVGVPVVYKPIDNFWLRTGPGFELVKDNDQDVSAIFLWRIGLGYDFHIMDFSVSPSFDLDYIRYHPAMVWGVNIGKGF